MSGALMHLGFDISGLTVDQIRSIPMAAQCMASECRRRAEHLVTDSARVFVIRIAATAAIALRIIVAGAVFAMLVGRLARRKRAAALTTFVDGTGAV